MVIFDSLTRIDTRLLLWCGKSHHCPGLMRLVRAVSRSGDGYLQVALPLLLWAVDPARWQALALHCALAFALERSLYLLLKPGLARRRPPEVLPSFSSVIQASDKFSFPSGHAMASMLLASVVALHAGALAWPLFVWAAAVAASRVLLGVHFPTDVIAGAALGAAIAQLTLPAL